MATKDKTEADKAHDMAQKSKPEDTGKDHNGKPEDTPGKGPAKPEQVPFPKHPEMGKPVPQKDGKEIHDEEQEHVKAMADKAGTDIHTGETKEKDKKQKVEHCPTCRSRGFIGGQVCPDCEGTGIKSEKTKAAEKKAAEDQKKAEEAEFKQKDNTSPPPKEPPKELPKKGSASAA